ncbi:MAG: hypothetical protein ABT15_06650 [Pseudonocardia sp. SCN 73-27]|nr:MULTISPECIES: helix-turn-helix domain-containing protein [Actinomycetes]ODU27489.1 MAG: hypothetical protein ABS80_03670 [Pseudonocardia sp. SCN 72-51]ODV07749.1 MAG: hypothetical protein ABT15_06650 [Pseudonocardia sp. SCN 73-27]
MPSNPAYSDEDLVTVAVAAELLGVHRNTLRRWVDAGELPERRTPGNHRLFRVGDLRKLNVPTITKPQAS